ncbi:glycoside hydrolase family 3 N-terminal domain-containing protein [Bacillus licheniformis]|nr:glycoside hydrolase family 3 N-terminal domain-containing protein [Bacillus licheniformis]
MRKSVTDASISARRSPAGHSRFKRHRSASRRRLARGSNRFPQAFGLAHTWDRYLIKQIGSAVGDEVRGFHHLDPAANGVNVWAPVVDLLRDPRWGRNEEGYSEDPF